jgi:cobalamin biosynthesis protein CobW
VTVDGVIAVIDGPAVAAGRFADNPNALAKQRAEDSSLDHDNPLEEVYEDQLLCADLIVLNKTDLMTPDERARVSEEIRATAPRAVKVVEASNGKLDPAILLGIGAAAETDIAGRPSHHDAETPHDHDDFESFVIEVPPLASPEDLLQRVAQAAAAHDILRVKGFAEVKGKPMRLVVHGVGQRIQHQFDRPWKPGEGRAGRLVVIGERGLDAASIRRLIEG